MGCEEIRNRFADDLRNELPEADRAELRRHLVSCQACREEFESLEQIWSGLDDIPGERPDAGIMRARFDEMLDAHAREWPAPDRRACGGASTRASRAGGRRPGSRWRRWVSPPACCRRRLRRIDGPAGGRAITPAADLVELRRELHDMREMLTLSLMQQQSATERLRGVSGSSQIEQPGTEIVRALLDTLMHDPNVNVRLASVDALRRFATQDVVQQATIRRWANRRSRSSRSRSSTSWSKPKTNGRRRAATAVRRRDDKRSRPWPRRLGCAAVELCEGTMTKSLKSPVSSSPCRLRCCSSDSAVVSAQKRTG